MLSLFTVILVVSTSTSVKRECQELEGASYSGVKKIISSFGEKCLNWSNFNTSQNFTTDRHPGECKHSYCCKPDASPRPWCFVSAEEGIDIQDCIIETCQSALELHQLYDTNTARVKTSDVGAASSGQGQTEPQNIHPPRESVAVKPDPGISRRVSFGPSKKKDIGALGYALGTLLMVVIIVLGTGITIGYVYRRVVKLRHQQEQRAYEQEMRRMNLPLSAFTNPACDLTDEQPAAASGEQEEFTEIHIINTPKTIEDNRLENVG